ncbi:membrane protein insertion efficiency factor YidD [Balneolales bacterium ANBcel1]|nr:membrane protein insertion efficiency factor YidD [Balneolales bacterium ANBcel1]
MRKLFILLVRGYQFFISPYFPTSCRYYPTCSNYAIDALRIHGVFKGTALAVWRILRCNPFSDGGEDPVPGSRDCCTDDHLHSDHRDNHPASEPSSRPAMHSAGAHTYKDY